MKKKFTPKFLKFNTLIVLIIFSPSLLIAQSLGSKLNATLLQAKQGEIVELPGFIKNDFPRIKYEKIILSGPQYLISDDPEYIRVPEAIAMKESVNAGSVRLYIYNVNGVKEPKKIDRKITAVIKNTGSSPMHIRMLKYSSQEPTTNYFKAGKEGLADYFASNGIQEIRTVKPGGVISIDKKLENNIVKFNELVHGIYEFVIDQPGEISVLQTAPSISGPNAFNQIKTVLAPKSHSGAGRGTFGVSNYKIQNDTILDTKDGAVQLIVADGEDDPWVVGKESTSGQEAHLAGNYGVMYNTEIKWKSSDGKGLALVTWNSRAGNNNWCGGMATSMIVDKGKYNGGIVQLPSDQLITKKAPEAILIQVFPPAQNGEEQTIKLKYSPPGASCLPTPLVFIPIEINSKTD